MKVVIVGCGYVGRVLARDLADAGHEVYGVRRGHGELPSGVVSVTADVLVPSSLRALPATCDLLVYAVAASASDEASYRAAYVDGLENVLAAVAASRLVFVSSTSVFGQRDGEWVDEGSEAKPNGFRGAIMLDAERLVHRYESVIVRLGGIYGPSRTRLIDTVREGSARLCEGPRFTNRIHRDDAARAIAHVALLSAPTPLYLGVDREPAAKNDVLLWMARQLGVPAPVVGDDVDVREGNKRCSSARLVASGFVFRYPTFRDGYGSLLRFPG